MGTLHEDLHALLRTEVAGWRTPLPLTEFKDEKMTNTPEFLVMCTFRNLFSRYGLLFYLAYCIGYTLDTLPWL
jgi:hypothetical protein